MKLNPWKISTLALTLALGAVVATGGVRPAAADEQPFMEAAKDSLERAIDKLEKGSTDKGGYRVKAIKNAKAALADVNAGIKWDNDHKSKDEKDRHR
ncbi:MAG: hypothetical protein IT374_13115 [Polyangiaceae bacterium]|nr:hypothetical protein [Polyangiaceae bacterium]